MPSAGAARIDLNRLRQMKAEGRKFAMLTAYDFPTAVAAQAAGIQSLLVGDSLGTVLLGHPNTRRVPLSLMITLAEAVRRGAPGVFLIGDMPYESMLAGPQATVEAACRFRDEAGCDAVKFEAAGEHHTLVEKLNRSGIDTIAHLGLRPQTVESPDGYRAQARDEASIRALVRDARNMVASGAVMILLEAIPPEASRAVVAEVNVPVIGCGAGPACDGHVVVTYDLLGLGTVRPPRFVPVLAHLSQSMEDAMRRFVAAIAAGSYPGPEHLYAMRKEAAGISAAP